jgi:hypothetical protein
MKGAYMKKRILKSVATLMMISFASTGVLAAEAALPEENTVYEETDAEGVADPDASDFEIVTADTDACVYGAEIVTMSVNDAGVTPGGNGNGDNTPDTTSDNRTPKEYVTSLNGIPIVVAKQKVDISSEFASAGLIKKFIVEPRGYAKVNKKGILVGKKPGTIKINAIDPAGSVVATVERVVYQPRLYPMTVTKRGEVIYAEDYLKGDSDYLVKPTGWTITKNLAVIDPETGKVTVGMDGKHGKALVTVVYGEGNTAAKYKATLNVNLPYLSATKLTLQAGTYKKLKLRNAPVGVPVIWSSSKEKVATVNDSGKIKAKKAGKCEISARVGEYEYICKLTVKGDDD